MFSSTLRLQSFMAKSISPDSVLTRLFLRTCWLDEMIRGNAPPAWEAVTLATIYLEGARSAKLYVPLLVTLSTSGVFAMEYWPERIVWTRGVTLAAVVRGRTFLSEH